MLITALNKMLFDTNRLLYMTYRLIPTIFSLGLLSCSTTSSLADVRSEDCTGSEVTIENEDFGTTAPVECVAHEGITTKGGVSVKPSADVSLSSEGTIQLGGGFRVEEKGKFRAAAGANRIPVSEFFVDLPETGKVQVTLHPGSTVQPGTPTKVAFGIPFPRGAVRNINQVIVADGSGQEIASHIVEVARWKSLGGDSSVDSLRSALVYVNTTFSNTNPTPLVIKYGQLRTLELGPQPDPKTTWVSIANGPFPDEYPSLDNVMEPAVYATFPADWLSATLIRGRTVPINSISEYQWFDKAYLNYSRTAVNDVSDYVSSEEKVDYIGDWAPWLFDRPMTLFGLYIRTGDVKWLRHAHRASQYYAKHINAGGYFDKKPCWDDGPACDLKYSYGKSMVADMLLTGDTSLKQQIEKVAAAGAEWEESYDAATTNFWTERHHSYALLAALSAWEATGSTQHANRVKQIVDASFDQAIDPGNGWSRNGSMQHTYSSHEGYAKDGYDGPIASPWMSALFADAIMQYYIHSEDPRALEFLANLGDYILEDTTTFKMVFEGQNLRLPYYLASPQFQEKFNDGWGDVEHTCDVAGITTKASWARKKLGGNSDSLASMSGELLQACEYNLGDWHREGADVNYGKTVWRLSPPRKYNWWFGSTHDMLWMLKNQ